MFITDSGAFILSSNMRQKILMNCLLLQYASFNIKPYTVFGTTYFQEAVTVHERDFADLDITAK